MLPLPRPPPRPLSSPQPLSPNETQGTPLFHNQIVISKQPRNQLSPAVPLSPNETQGTPLFHNQIVISKQPRNQLSPAVRSPDPVINKLGEQTTLRHPQPRRTNPIIWFCAILCLIFSLILIFFGIATLITFLVVKPRIPVFDTPNAILSTIYFDSPEYFNGDFTLLANFSNPNRKIDVRFKYADIELYFSDKLVATQGSQPFTLRRGETRLESVHMISSLVYLPQKFATELRMQVQSNRVKYNVRATFKVTATLGLLHFSYRLHGRCEIEMTGPPTGILVARSCKTKR
ncbi:hypothetical protein HS088_TW21G00643 [Tripterygium wilfordii]|uniref:Late embryogenesis abundant protein LEA-2 subgroup domain-containing protein n=1 Tax=Tripterygium wilfordii TaxID=458696 RepID=A0A7J7C3J0_TRIWF|nr:uncharacterized protein LOC119989712 [Tripterygium wilfordii]KAF5728495.1 hypothetical protein HS088_TW21G00643 [Tripterygium wilfordii]